MIAEQKMVYATVNEHIQSGAIHALTIKACTPDEWAMENA
jgi:acid stress-induced BolA-like protein IbaG/YrbA